MTFEPIIRYSHFFSLFNLGHQVDSANSSVAVRFAVGDNNAINESMILPFAF